MVESILDPEKVENNTEVYYIDRANRASLLPREPSFSGWCEEHDLPHLHPQLQNSEASVKDSDFELLSLQEGELEKKMPLNGGLMIPYMKKGVGMKSMCRLILKMVLEGR